MLRMAAIGCGDIAQRRHFPALQALAHAASLVAIAGRNPARTAACAAAFKIPHWTTNPAEIIANPSIDAVLILTPPDTHAHLAEAAIAAGKHVMIEKPLATTAAETRRLATALHAAPRPVTVMALPHAAATEHANVTELLRQNAIGQPTGIECNRSHRGPSHAGWFYAREKAGGGVLLDLGIYGLSTIAGLFGPATAMTALCTRQFPTRTLDDATIITPDVEDSAQISLTLESGVTASLNANWNGCLSHHHTRARTTIFGRDGILHFGVADQAIYLHRPDNDHTRLTLPSEPALFDGQPCRRIETTAQPAPAIVATFIDRIAAQDTSTRSLDLQAHVMEIIFQAYAAANAPTLPQTRFAR